MSKECKIIEDLLPLYHDGICSQESREMVEAHLAQCENCCKILSQIDIELVPPSEEVSDIDQLKSLAKKIMQKQKTALIKGVAFTLAFLLFVFSYNCILWYAQEYRFYKPFTEGLTYMPTEPALTEDRYYYWMDDTYDATVAMPGFLSRSGYVSVRNTANDGQLITGIDIVPAASGKYIFHVSLLCEQPDTYHLFVIDSDLNLVPRYYRHRPNKEQDQAELDQHREEVQALIDLVKELWPFLS